MKRLEALVQAVERADSLRRRTLARQLSREALPESLRGRANTVLPEALAQAPRLPDRVGETWVLLAKDGSSGLVARVGTRPTQEPLDPKSLRVARAALLRVVGRACRRLPSEARDVAGIFIQDELDAAVTGRSAELSAAVALVSLALGRPPLPHVAGSAQLALDGRLEPVLHLAEKLEALRREWPLVTKVVVAREQSVDGSHGVEIVRAANLDDALGAYGLDVRDLGACDVDDHEARVGGLKAEGEKQGADFQRLATDAWESASVLAETRPDLAAKARGYAALFLLHLGESREAWNMQEGVDRKSLEGEPDILAMLDTFAASAAIDVGQAEMAKELARSAMTGLGPPRSREHGAMVASACGTYGRAFLHAGEHAEAMGHLARAVELQQAHAPLEVPRSRGYLATAQRLAGKLAEARETLALALEQNAREAPSRSASRQTTPFLRLEAGRLALAEGNLPEAERHLLAVGENPTRYPDLGALRTRVLVALRRGDFVLAKALAETCASVVPPDAKPSALAEVGAVGYAELVVAGVATPEEEARAMELLTRAFGREISQESVPELVARQVF